MFDAVEVAALAAELADEPRARRLRNAGREPGANPAPRSADEVAAEVFERLEQRQSLAEIVVGVRIAPERVREFHEQWCRGLIEGQLRYARAPHVPLDRDYVRIPLAELATRLAELPEGMIRISVARYRGAFNAPTPEGDDAEFAWVSELGGFHVPGPCDVNAIVRRFGKGDYRVTAYEFNPPGLLWEVIVKDVRATM